VLKVVEKSKDEFGRYLRKLKYLSSLKHHTDYTKAEIAGVVSALLKSKR